MRPNEYIESKRLIDGVKIMLSPQTLVSKRLRRM